MNLIELIRRAWKVEACGAPGLRRRSNAELAHDADHVVPVTRSRGIVQATRRPAPKGRPRVAEAHLLTNRIAALQDLIDEALIDDRQRVPGTASAVVNPRPARTGASITRSPTDRRLRRSPRATEAPRSSRPLTPMPRHPTSLKLRWTVPPNIDVVAHLDDFLRVIRRR